MRKMTDDIPTFILSQLVIGMTMLMFGGLIAPYFWKNPTEDRGAKIFLFVVWFVGSWTIVLSVFFPNLFIPIINYIDFLIYGELSYQIPLN